MNKYLLNLFKQFNDMLGIKILDFNQESYKTEFINWILKYIKIIFNI